MKPSFHPEAKSRAERRFDKRKHVDSDLYFDTTEDRQSRVKGRHPLHADHPGGISRFDLEALGRARFRLHAGRRVSTTLTLSRRRVPGLTDKVESWIYWVETTISDRN